MNGNDDDSILNTIEEEVAEAAKAVVADVKSIATEVADALAEGKAELREALHPSSPPAADKPASSKDDENSPR